MPAHKKRKFMPSRRIRKNSEEVQPEEPVETFKKQEKKDKADNFWYIANGYLNDLIDLLEDFETSPGWKFQDFSAFWKKKSFSLVYRGRQTFKELLEFSEEIAFLTKRFLLRPHSIKRRIGALYCLYGLHAKHPMRQYFDLRFSLQEYKETLDLVQPYRCNPEMPDPAFIFRKLEVCGAIKHCASSLEMCYDYHNRERELVDLEYGKEKLIKSSAVNEAVPTAQLEANQQLLYHYHNMKLQLSGNAAHTERAICLVNHELFNDVIGELAELKKQSLDELGIKDRHKVASNDSFNVQSSEANENDVMAERSQDEIDISVDRNTNNASSVIDDLEEASDEEDIISAINGSKRGLLTKAITTEKRILADTGINNFMAKNGTFQNMFMPKVHKSKKSKKVQLNLNDFKAQPYVERLPHSELLLSVPQLDKEKRSRKRTVALRDSIKSKAPRVRRGVQYRPNQPKEDPELLSDVTKSATGLQLNKPHPQGMLQMLVKLDLNGEEISRKLNLKVTAKQWQEMNDDPDRMERFQKRIIPLLGISHSFSDGIRIIDITAVPAEDSPRKIRKSKSKTAKSVLNSVYMKEQRDEDYDPFSDEEEGMTLEEVEEEYVNKIDVDSGDELDDFEDVDEHLSDEEERNSFRSKFFKDCRKRKYCAFSDYYFQRDRVGVFNSDLIAPKKNAPHKLKMIPVQVGQQIKYIPMMGDKQESIDDSLPTVYAGSDMNDIPDDLAPLNDDSEFHSFNDYTTIDKPPVHQNRHSFYDEMRKKKSVYPFTIMCVRAKSKVASSDSTTPPKQTTHPTQPTPPTQTTPVAKKKRVKVPKRQSPDPVDDNSFDSDPVFFDHQTDDGAVVYFLEQKREKGDSPTKVEMPSPLKSNTEIKLNLSIEDLANDWNDIEDVPVGEVYMDYAEPMDDAHTDDTFYNADSNTSHLMPAETKSPFQMFDTETPNPCSPLPDPPISLVIPNPVVTNQVFTYTTPLVQYVDQSLSINEPIIPLHHGISRTSSPLRLCNPPSASLMTFTPPSLPATPSQRKATCGFLFSSKFKSLKRLSTSQGEASGKPPTRRRSVAFFRKGPLKT